MLILQIQQADNIHLVELAREDRVISCFVEAGFSSRISADTIPEALSLLSLHHCILAVSGDTPVLYGAATMPKIVLPYYYKELLVSLLEHFVERLVERLFERSRISMNASLSASQSCACSSDQEYQ